MGVMSAMSSHGGTSSELLPQIEQAAVIDNVTGGAGTRTLVG